MTLDQVVRGGASGGTFSSGEPKFSGRGFFKGSTHAEDPDLVHGQDDELTVQSEEMEIEPQDIDAPTSKFPSPSFELADALGPDVAETGGDSATTSGAASGPTTAEPTAVTPRPRRRPPGSGIEVRSFGTTRTCQAAECSTRLSRYNPDHFCSVHRGWDSRASTRQHASE